MNIALSWGRTQGPLAWEKLVSVAVAGLALILLTPLATQEAIIVFGQGHFFACYYYQYKYHRIDRPYLFRYFAAMILLFGGYLLYPNLFLLVTVASVYFVVHLSVDERFLWRDPPNLQRLLALLPFLILYAGMIIDGIYQGQVHLARDSWLGPAQSLKVPILGIWVTPYCMAGAGLALLGYLVYLKWNSRKVETHDLYFLTGAAVLAVLFATGHVPNYYYLMGAIILFHYSSWYVHYFVKWGEDRPKRRRYVLNMLWVNALVLGLYALYRVLPEGLAVDYLPRQIFPYKDPAGGNILAYLFSPGYFYLWTLMHFVSTARVSDLGYFKEGSARGR